MLRKPRKITSKPETLSLVINRIGTLKEKTLHAQLKKIYAQDKYPTEVELEGCFIDVRRPGDLVEIQTRNLMQMKKKLKKLLPLYKVRLVHPIAEKKYITTYDATCKTQLYRRKSPKNMQLHDLGKELMHMTDILIHRNLTLEILFIIEEETRVQDGNGSWRRKGVSIVDRKLLELKRKVVFRRPMDYLKLIPGKIPREFTNALMAEKKNIPVWKMRMVTYVLRKIGVIETVGKTGRSQLFAVVKK